MQFDKSVPSDENQGYTILGSLFDQLFGLGALPEKTEKSGRYTEPKEPAALHRDQKKWIIDEFMAWLTTNEQGRMRKG